MLIDRFSCVVVLFCLVGTVLSYVPAETTAVPDVHHHDGVPCTIIHTTAYTTKPPKRWNWEKNYEDNNEKKYYDNYNLNYHDDKYDGKDDDYPRSNGYERKYRKPSSIGHLNIYVRGSNKDGRSKRYKRYRVPTARYNRQNFPPFGQLFSFLPWIPIFTDRLTKQTFIFSPTGGIYILPPLINFFGKLISVAELIASGYASLVSTGIPPPPALDVAPLVSNTPVTGPGVPKIDEKTGGFNGGYKTNLREYPQAKYPPSVAKYYECSPC